MREGERMTRTDAAWYRMDTDDNHMIVTARLHLDGAIDLDKLRAVAAYRLSGTLPRFRQNVVKTRTGFRWQDDRAFDIARHIVESERIMQSDDDVAKFVGETMSEGLEGNHPLWQFTVLRHGDGSSSVIARIHHSIADGIALIAVLLSLTDLDAAGVNPTPIPVPPAETKRRMPVKSRIIASGRAAAGAAKQANAVAHVTALTKDNTVPFHGALSGEKRVAWSDEIALNDIKAFNSAGYTVNDVVVAAAAGALRKWLLEVNCDVGDLTMRASVPINLRPLERALELGNQFGLTFLDLPVAQGDPKSRLAATKRAMDELKSSSEAGAALNVLRTVGSLPASGQDAATKLFAGKASAVLSNVPGPPMPLFLAGQEIEDLMFWAPPTGPVGVGIGILTYNGKVRMSLTTDSALVAQPEKITQYFVSELDSLSRAVLGRSLN